MEEYKVESNITREEFQTAREIIDRIREYYEQRMVGQKQLELSLITTMMANGHILLESVPGLAKTTAAKTLTEAVNGKFSRIQCTPDLLPSDIIGTQMFNYATNQFETTIGPVYANFVLLDEINRSSAKTQSAMLEVMQEKQTTIGGKIYKMPDIFTVIATQNPIEQEGTYLLAEAQLDRFLLKEKVEYPTVNEEFEVLNRIEKNAFVQGKSTVKLKELQFVQDITQRVYIDDSVKKYIVNIVDATRHPKDFISEELAKYIELGASPRANIAFMQVSKAVALLSGRNYVTPEDVKRLRYSVLRHRITLNFSAIADEISVEKIIDEIIGAIKTP